MRSLFRAIGSLFGFRDEQHTEPPKEESKFNVCAPIDWDATKELPVCTTTASDGMPALCTYFHESYFPNTDKFLTMVWMSKVIPGDTDISILDEATLESPDWMRVTSPDTNNRIHGILQQYVVKYLERKNIIVFDFTGVAYGSWFLDRLAAQMAGLLHKYHLDLYHAGSFNDEDPSISKEFQGYLNRHFHLQKSIQ